jgi:transposase
LALPSDLTDGEWALLEPFLPPPSHVGRPRKWPLRRIVEAILYLLRGGAVLPARLDGAALVPAQGTSVLRRHLRCHQNHPREVQQKGMLKLPQKLRLCADVIESVSSVMIEKFV